MLRLYGIANCDTVRKARKWLADADLEYTFIDFKKSPPNTRLIAKWLEHVDLKDLVNKRSTTWRGLAEAQKSDLDVSQTITLLALNPTLIKRPVLDTGSAIMVGFNEDKYQALI